MNKWKIGAIIGAAYGLLGAIFLPTAMCQCEMLIPGQTLPPVYTPPHDYAYTRLPIGMIVFLPIFWSVGAMLSVLNIIFPNVSSVDSFVLLLFPIHGALIGAGVGYLIDKYRR